MHQFRISFRSPRLALSVIFRKSLVLFECPGGSHGTLIAFRWMADRYTQEWEHLGGIRGGQSPKLLHIRQLAFLAHCFFAPEATRNHMGTVTEEIEWKVFFQFILAISHPLANRIPHQAWPSCYVWQFHLHYFAPVRREWTSSPLNVGGLVVQRQYAKIRRNQNDHGQQYFEERALSVSLQTYPYEMEFKIIVLGDSGAKVKPRPGFEADHTIPKTAAGSRQFLVIVRQLMECWVRGWNDTLDVIDNIIEFQVGFSVNFNKACTIIMIGLDGLYLG